MLPTIDTAGIPLHCQEPDNERLIRRVCQLEIAFDKEHTVGGLVASRVSSLDPPFLFGIENAWLS